MDALQFRQYLIQPALLAHLSMRELDALVEKYPFCAPLRFLLLKKYQIEQPAELERILPIQASYAPDRLRLHEFLHLSPRLETLAEAAVLPTATMVSQNPPRISAEELGIEKKTLIPTDLALAFDNLMDFFSLNDYLESDLAQQIMPKKTPKEPLRKKESADKAKPKTSKKRFRLPRIPTLENANVFDLFAADDTNSTEYSNSIYHLEDTSNFNNVDDAFLFLSQTEDFLKSIAKRVSNHSMKSAENELANESYQSKDLAQQEDLDSLVMESVTDNEFIASETLAQLLTKQGQVQRAIKMYQQLCLQQPHKLAYFEQIIEDLKTKK